MRPEFGRIVAQAEPAELRAAIEELLADEGLRKKMGQAGQEFARTQRFSDAAARLAEILKG